MGCAVFSAITRDIERIMLEYVDGVVRKSVELFRRYESYAEAFADWATLMAANPPGTPTAASSACRASGRW